MAEYVFPCILVRSIPVGFTKTVGPDKIHFGFEKRKNWPGRSGCPPATGMTDTTHDSSIRSEISPNRIIYEKLNRPFFRLNDLKKRSTNIDNIFTFEKRQRVPTGDYLTKCA